jgi:hypothetical protein
MKRVGPGRWSHPLCLGERLGTFCGKCKAILTRNNSLKSNKSAEVLENKGKARPTTGHEGPERE